MTPEPSWRRRILQAWPVLVPLLLAAIALYFLREPIYYWRQGESLYDEQAIQEWVREARVGSSSLPEMLKDFFDHAAESSADLRADPGSAARIRAEHKQKREEIQQFLAALCVPPTKIYAGQLPLFPIIYRVEVRFDDALKKKYDPSLDFEPIVWDSESPRHPNQYRELTDYQISRDEGAKIYVQYQLHAYLQKQFHEREDDAKRRLTNLWVLVFAFVALLWMLLMQRRQDARERQRLQTEQQIQESRQKHLEEELRRQEAERKQEEAERKQLELKSQMFHSIGIMAKSYAHNIKNLLVRPNDLLRRCLEEEPATQDKAGMLREIQQTLGTVTERLQEILQTVQRDPHKFERVRIDLNALAQDLHKTWAEQAETKWKMVVELDLYHATPLPQGEGHGVRAATELTPIHVSGDRSHLQQMLENFLFNARDAIGEMRNYLRKQARPEGVEGHGPLDEAQRQALIAAAGWKGRVVIRTALIGGHPVIEVEDNGIGMTQETRDHCTEPNFSTKRNNALYAGLSAGMGLGLSFVQMILEHHGATLEIDSEPLKGARLRVRFPAAGARPAQESARP